MIRTRVGYSGGTKSNPTYKSLGDHTETIQIDDAIYPYIKNFVDSSAVSRVNGYLGGYGTAAQLRGEITSLGLSEAGQKRLLDYVVGSGR